MIVDDNGKIFEDRRGKKTPAQNKSEKVSRLRKKHKVNLNRRQEDKKK